MKNLKFRQFLSKASQLMKITAPKHPSSYIQYFREGLNMTQSQLAKRMGVSQSAIKQFELSEKKRSISLKNLERAANEMNAELCFFFRPKSDMKSYIEEEALKKAKIEVLRVEHSMSLENQGSLEKETQIRIHDLANEYAEQLSKKIWD